MDVIGGGTPSKRNPAFYGGAIPWATVRDMNVDYITRTEHTITEQGLSRSSTKVISAGEVIIATRVGLGKVCILNHDTAINQDLRGLVPKPGFEIERKYLFYWLKSIAQTIVAAGTGATVQGVKLTFIKALKFPLPPLEEQRRIVAFLDKAFEGLDRARANAEANLQNARELFMSAIKAAFDELRDAPLQPVGKVADNCLGKMLDKRKNRGIPREYLRNLNVRWFTIDTSDLLEMRIEDAEVERYSVRRGDLLICEGGYPGRAAIWNEDDLIFFQKALHRVRFSQPAYSKLLMFFLFLQDQLGDLRPHFTGSGIQHFTGKALAKFEMPFPPPDAAEATVRKLDAVQSKTDELMSVCMAKLNEVKELRRSLLQKAFAGELT